MTRDRQTKHVWKQIFFVLVAVMLLFTGGQKTYAAKKKNVLVEVKASAKDQAKGYTVRYKYYNSKGKVTKNDWVTVKVDGKKEKMYFGSNGKAYQAPKVFGFTNNVVTYKIGKYTYGFDCKGRMVKGYAASAGFGSKVQYYYFASSGKLKSSKTKTFTSAITTGMKKNCTKLAKLLGTPVTLKEIEICMGEDWTGELWTYNDLMQVQIKKNVKDGSRLIIAVSAAQEGL